MKNIFAALSFLALVASLDAARIRAARNFSEQGTTYVVGRLYYVSDELAFTLTGRGDAVLTPEDVKIGDTGNVDAFSRLRVSQPQGVFDAQFTNNLQPLLFEQVTSGAGATIAHDAVNRCALMTFASTPTGGLSYMQSYEYVRYQPGRSQAIFITFNGEAANVTKFAGYGDETNAVRFELPGNGVPQFSILSGTQHGLETVTQPNWNLDKLDGKGPSGYTLDLAKKQILVLDMQALYAGRVRCGFDIDGKIIYAHEYLQANIEVYPYIQTASLPIRVGMFSTGTASTTMRFICSAVLSEGGQEELGGIPVAIEGTGTAANGSDTHIISVRPKLTFNGLVNHSKFIPDSVDIVVTGNFPVSWKVVIGQAITGTTTFADVNTTYSAFEYNTAGTISGAPALIMQQGYCAASNTVKSTANPKIASRVPISLSASDTHRINGTLTVTAQGIGGASAIRVIVNWRELR